jgi:integrase
VLTREEVRAVLQRLDGVPRLMALSLYGGGLRLLERCRLRVEDVDFAVNQIVIRDGKGRRDRVTMLPVAVKVALTAHLERVIPTSSPGTRPESRAPSTGCSSEEHRPSAAISDIRARYPAGPRGLLRPRGRATLRRWRNFRHPLDPVGPVPVIYRPTHSGNTVPVTSRSNADRTWKTRDHH